VSGRRGGDELRAKEEEKWRKPESSGQYEMGKWKDESIEGKERETRTHDQSDLLPVQIHGALDEPVVRRSSDSFDEIFATMTESGQPKGASADIRREGEREEKKEEEKSEWGGCSDGRREAGEGRRNVNVPPLSLVRYKPMIRSNDFLLELRSFGGGPCT
jgi:hypothetical protein